MLAKEAVRKLCRDSGLGLEGTAVKLGRNKSWLTCTTSRNLDITCSTLCEVGKVSGFKLCLVPERKVRGDFIVIDTVDKTEREEGVES